MLVATAGHVDHGKSSLIKSLTGTNTDRLAEEKKRGLTIELGYAFGKTQHQDTLGFIDVPGHHGFINTMISGITGIDLGMLIVAADDGPMPQTIEHLQLLRLLGVTHYIGVITKCDLVDKEQVAYVKEQVKALLVDAPICVVSNPTGEGLEQLNGHLDHALKKCPPRISESQFRLYIDRVFIKKGAGMVVTGTCLSGSVNVGDELRLHASTGINSQNINIRVREVHSQGKQTTSGHVGQRCALNISGKVSINTVHRGDFLCANSAALPCRRLDTRCWTIDDSTRELKHLGKVKLYIGTRRLGAKTYLLDRTTDATNGQRVQLILDRAVLAFAGDRFILRDDNESTTLGGGIVIDPEAPQWGKARSKRLKQLDALEAGKPKDALERQLFVNQDTLSLRQYKRIWNLTQKEIDDLLSQSEFAGKLKRIDDSEDEIVISRQCWQNYVTNLQQQLGEWHNARPMEAGITPERLRERLGLEFSKSIFKAALNDQISLGKIIYNDQLIHAVGHKPSLSPQIQKEWQQLETCMIARDINIPLRSELQKDTGFDAKKLENLTRPAIKRGDLFEIGEKRIALPSMLKNLAGRLEKFIQPSNEFSVIDAKKAFGLGRNLTIEILEFFDKVGFTKRTDNIRRIANANSVNFGQTVNRTKGQ